MHCTDLVAGWVAQVGKKAFRTKSETARVYAGNPTVAEIERLMTAASKGGPVVTAMS